MAITDENGGIGATMLVGPTGYGAMPYPVYQNGNGGNNGGFGNDWAWIIILLLAFGGGFNRGFGGGNGGFGGGSGDGYGLYPWLNNSNQINDGFRDQMLQNSVMSIRDGIGNLSTQLCNCCSDINGTITSAAANAETAANARAIANMQQLYGLSSQFADCCCENRLGIADLKYTVATENCADRAALSDGIRDVIANQTAGVQRILDKLCDQELQAERRDNQNLRSELMYARGQASQIEQTAALRAGQQAAVNSLVTELRSCPIPSQPVYGNTPIFSCSNNSGCGCGCGNGFAG